MSQDATLSLVLELKAKTDELRQGQKELIAFQKNAESANAAFGSIAKGFASGLGIGGALSVLGLVKTAISEAVDGMKALVLEGVHLNSTMETAQISVAGALRQFFPERFKSFTDALKGSAQVIDLMRQKSVDFGISFDDLAHTYQATVGSMFRAGIFDINKQVELVATLQRSLAGLGVTGQRAARDIADIFNGQANRIVAAKALGISNEDIAAAKGRGELYEYLQAKLSGYKEASDFAADSTERLESRLANTKASVAADATKELSAAYKDLLKSLIDLVKSDAFKDSVKLLADAARGAVNVVSKVSNFVTKQSLTPGAESRKFEQDAADIAKQVAGASSDAEANKIRAVADAKIQEIKASIEKFKDFNQSDRNLLASDRAAPINKIRASLSELDKNVANNKSLVEERAREESAARIREAEEAAGLQLEKNANKLDTLKAKTELVGLADEARLSVLDQIVEEINKQYDTKAAAATGPKQLELLAYERQKELLPYITQQAALEAKITAEKERQRVAVDKSLTTFFNQVASEASRLEVEKARATLVDLDARKAEIQNDRYKTRREKQAELLELLKQEPAALDAIIAKLELVAASTDDAAAAETITTEVNALKKRKAKLPAEQEKDATPQNALEEAQAGSVALQNNFVTLGQAISNTMGAAVNGISSGIEGLINKTETFGQALRSVYTGIASSIVKSFADMAAQWLVQHTIMSAVSNAFRVGEVGGHAATEAAKTGITVAGESSRTGTTLIGSLARRGIHLAETIFHGIQVAIRTAAHVIGEVTKTAATLVNTPIRIAATLSESFASVVKGAVEAFSAMASIPYVGPFLGAAAMAAALAGGLALVKSASKGFADGGYHSGPGGPRSDSIPVNVSNGEYTLNAATTARIGKDRLDAMNFGGKGVEDIAGRQSVTGAGGAGGGTSSGRGSAATAAASPVVNVAVTPSFIVVDSDRAADRINDTSANEAYVVRLMRKHGAI